MVCRVVAVGLLFGCALAGQAADPIVKEVAVTPNTRSISTGAGLSGGGNLTANRTLVVDLSTLVGNQTLWDSSQGTRTITFGLSGATDPVLTLGNNSVDWTTGVLKVGGNTVATSANDLSFFGFAGALSFPDGVRQTFNPNGTAAGLNVGSQAGDPSAPSNGDLWYDSTANELTARINGANVALGSGSGIGDVTAAAPFGTNNVVIISDGTGKGTKGSLALIDTSGNVSTPGTISAVEFIGTGPVADSRIKFPDDDGSNFYTLEAAGVLSANVNEIVSLPSADGFYFGTWVGTNLTRTYIAGTGSGSVVRGTSPTITTPTIAGAITFPDGVKQTFNPDGTTAGLNVGSQAGDPSTPTNGDLWYDSTANELTARINGANVALGAGGGGSALTVQELDGSPSDTAVTVIKVTNGKLTDNGTGDVTLDLSGGVSSPTAGLFDQIMHNGTADIKRNPSMVFYFYDDFVYASATTATPWSSTGSGGIGFSTAEAGHPFILNIDCATTTVSKYLQLANAGVIVGGGQIGFEAQVRIPDLSDAAEEYSVRLGLIDTSGDSTDGVYFKYDRAGSGVNWFAVTAKAGSRTSTDTTIAVTAAAWHTLKLIVNAAGTSVTFYIDGSSVITTTTNLPDTSSNGTGPGFGIVASAGTTAAVRRLEIDWVQVGQIFSTPR